MDNTFCIRSINVDRQKILRIVQVFWGWVQDDFSLEIACRLDSLSVVFPWNQLVCLGPGMNNGSEYSSLIIESRNKILPINKEMIVTFQWTYNDDG